MKRHLITLIAFTTLASCDKVSNRLDNVKVNSNGDTLETIKRYPSDSIKEVVYYLNNRPNRNIGLYKNGDTIKRPDVVYIKEDGTLFAFIPLDSSNSYDIYIGVDSGVTSQPILDKLHNITNSLKKLRLSTTFPLPSEFVYDGKLKGVFKCMNDSTGNTMFKYQPFVVRVE